MSIKDYSVNNDHFEPADKNIVPSFPCCACLHALVDPRLEPCRSCGHNLVVNEFEDRGNLHAMEQVEAEYRAANQ